MDLAVVGGGPAAVSLLDALARREPGPGRARPGRLLIFESSEHLWRGGPYRGDLDEVRVNLPPAMMSARHGDPAHFADWLRAAPYDEERYTDTLLGPPMPPRHLYGDYLEETAEAAVAALRTGGWRVETVRDRVTGASRGERLTLHCATGAGHTVDRAVLCVGSGSPHDLYGLDGTPGFTLNPYPLRDTLGSLGPEAEVAVIGSGLTAMDVVAALAGRGHRGRISLLSRHGVIPSVQQRGFRFEPRHLTRERLLELAGQQGPLTLDQLPALLQAELAEFGEGLEPVLAEVAGALTEPPVDRLRRQLDEVDAEARARRILLFLVRSLGPVVMSLLTERDRARVGETHFRTVTSLSAPMIPSNASTVLTLSDKGQLDIVGGLQGIAPAAGGGFTVRAGGVDRTADVVINAVNPSPHETSPPAADLLASLAGSGFADLTGGRGLATDPVTGRLLVRGRPQDTLYALGDLADVNLFLTSAMSALVAQTPGIADALLSVRPERPRA